MKISENFSLEEFLISQTANRIGGDMLVEQQSPSEEVLDNLIYLVEGSIQPLRTLLRTPMTISSGFRSPLLNRYLNSKDTSQHVVGQAADVLLSDELLTNSNLGRQKRIVENLVTRNINKGVRESANSNFYLFAVAAIYLDELDVLVELVELFTL